MPKIKLGDRVRDTYTGFEGTAIAHTVWLYGCARWTIEPTVLDKDGKPIEAHTFDEQRVELVIVQEPTKAEESTAKTGGPQRDPGRGR